MKTIYIFGNKYLRDDSFAHKVSEHLTGFKLQSLESPEMLLEEKENELLILDVVKGIQEPVIISDINKLKSRKLISLHDFDVTFFLKLAKQLGILTKIKILGVPTTGNPKEIAKKVQRWIE